MSWRLGNRNGRAIPTFFFNFTAYSRTNPPTANQQKKHGCMVIGTQNLLTILDYNKLHERPNTVPFLISLIEMIGIRKQRCLVAWNLITSTHIMEVRRWNYFSSLLHDLKHKASTLSTHTAIGRCWISRTIYKNLLKKINYTFLKKHKRNSQTNLKNDFP